MTIWEIVLPFLLLLWDQFENLGDFIKDNMSLNLVLFYFVIYFVEIFHVTFNLSFTNIILGMLKIAFQPNSLPGCGDVG